MLDPEKDYIVVLIRSWPSNKGYDLKSVNVIVNGMSITGGAIRYAFDDSRQIASKILVAKCYFSTEDEATDFIRNHYNRVVFSVTYVARKKDL